MYRPVCDLFDYVLYIAGFFKSWHVRPCCYCFLSLLLSVSFSLSVLSQRWCPVYCGPHPTPLRPFSRHIPPTHAHSYSRTLSHTDTHSSHHTQWKTMTPSHSHRPTYLHLLHTHPLSVLYPEPWCVYCLPLPPPPIPPPSGTHYVGQWLVSTDWASGKKNTIISALGYSRKGDKSWYEVWNPKSFSHAEADKLGLICARVHACVSEVFTFARFPVLK